MLDELSICCANLMLSVVLEALIRSRIQADLRTFRRRFATFWVKEGVLLHLFLDDRAFWFYDSGGCLQGVS